MSNLSKTCSSYIMERGPCFRKPWAWCHVNRSPGSARVAVSPTTMNPLHSKRSHPDLVPVISVSEPFCHVDESNSPGWLKIGTCGMDTILVCESLYLLAGCWHQHLIITFSQSSNLRRLCCRQHSRSIDYSGKISTGRVTSPYSLLDCMWHV